MQTTFLSKVTGRLSSPRTTTALTLGCLGVALLLGASHAEAKASRTCKAKLMLKANGLDAFELGTITGSGWKKDGSYDTNRGRARKAVTECIEAALENNSDSLAAKCRIKVDANESDNASEVIKEYNLNPNLRKQIQAELCSRAKQKGMDRFTDGIAYLMNLTSEDGCERGASGTVVLRNFSVQCGERGSSFHSNHTNQSLAPSNQKGSEALEKMKKHCDSKFDRPLIESSVKFSVADERLGTLKATFDCR
jgi:hypothetical protein